MHTQSLIDNFDLNRVFPLFRIMGKGLIFHLVYHWLISFCKATRFLTWLATHFAVRTALQTRSRHSAGNFAVSQVLYLFKSFYCIYLFNYVFIYLYLPIYISVPVCTRSREEMTSDVGFYGSVAVYLFLHSWFLVFSISYVVHSVISIGDFTPWKL